MPQLWLGAAQGLGVNTSAKKLQIGHPDDWAHVGWADAQVEHPESMFLEVEHPAIAITPPISANAITRYMDCSFHFVAGLCRWLLCRANPHSRMISPSSRYSPTPV
jgi:hypothetical protein